MLRRRIQFGASLASVPDSLRKTGIADGAMVVSVAEHMMLVEDINALHPNTASYAENAGLDHYLSRQASQKASMADPIAGLSRPYYGATLEPVLDHWLDSLSRRK